MGTKGTIRGDTTEGTDNETGVTEEGTTTEGITTTVDTITDMIDIGEARKTPIPTPNRKGKN